MPPSLRKSLVEAAILFDHDIVGFLLSSTVHYFLVLFSMLNIFGDFGGFDRIEVSCMCLQTQCIRLPE